MWNGDFGLAVLTLVVLVLVGAAVLVLLTVLMVGLDAVRGEHGRRPLSWGRWLDRASRRPRS